MAMQERKAAVQTIRKSTLHRGSFLDPAWSRRQKKIQVLQPACILYKKGFFALFRSKTPELRPQKEKKAQGKGAGMEQKA